jgi:hypothetical protein
MPNELAAVSKAIADLRRYRRVAEDPTCLLTLPPPADSTEVYKAVSDLGRHHHQLVTDPAYLVRVSTLLRHFELLLLEMVEARQQHDAKHKQGRRC